MKLQQTLFVCAAMACLPAAVAQKWEFGGGAGMGYYTANDVTSPAGSASARIKTGIAASGWIANQTTQHWGGEFRYNYQRSDMGLSQGSTRATFAGDSHSLSYDFVYHFKDQEYRVRPFVAVGGGIKAYRGTGQEVLLQPLSRIALLTKAQDVVPMISVAAGFKVQLSPSAQLRLDLHDFITPFPKEVIVPNGGKASGWVNNLVPMIGISWTK